MKALLRLVPAALLAASLAAGAHAADDPLAAARESFKTAWTAADAGLPAAAEDGAELRAYPIYPYLVALRLRRELARTPLPADLDARIAGFLTVQGDALPGRELRRAWLGSLADRAEWPRFEGAYREAQADATLRCQHLAARVALGKADGLAAAITEEWLKADKSPAACDPAFDWLRSHQALTPALIEQRARLALAAGNAALARTLAAALPKPAAAPLLQWAALIENPQREIDALLADPARPVENAALLDGWQRLARRDPDGSAARWPKFVESRGQDAAVASPYARALALGLAWSRRPAALDYFAMVARTDLDEVANEWWARAALWNGDWAQAARVILAMPPALRAQPRWRYWGAVAAKQLGEPAADDALTQLTAEDGWYPALAAARLGQPYAPHPQPLALDGAAQARLTALPGFVRARELFLVALKTQASAEWAQALDALSPADRTQAIGLAAALGWYDQAIATASKQAVFTDYQLLYPRPFDDIVHDGATRAELPEPLIYGVVRQESLYRADAVSKADAQGLMQLLRETAQRTARRWQLPAPAGNALFDPAVNIPLGSAHLRELVDRFDGQIPLAIAAYNAGPGAAARWLPPQPLSTDVWIENIPFNETRTYVSRVLWHALVFAWRGDGEAQKLDRWLAPVTPAGAGS